MMARSSATDLGMVLDIRIKIRRRIRREIADLRISDFKVGGEV